MPNWNRTHGEDFQAFALTIPNADSNAKLLVSACTVGATNLKKILHWSVEDADGAWRWSRNSGMTAPAQEVAAYVPFAPEVVGDASLKNVYVRSSTGGSTITANLVVTFGDQERA